MENNTVQTSDVVQITHSVCCTSLNQLSNVINVINVNNTKLFVEK